MERDIHNENFEIFCQNHGISHNFYTPRTSQQNDVVERKNRSLEELAITNLNEKSLPKYLWVDVVSTCYVLNRTLIGKILKITPYELF